MNESERWRETYYPEVDDPPRFHTPRWFVVTIVVAVVVAIVLALTVLL